jgi:hypothetical protein
MLSALWMAGCNSGLRFYEVHGVVTVNGKPVEYAEMHIHPLSETANRGRTVFVHIVNGKYDTRRMGGVAAGPAEWTIVAAEPGAIRIADPENVSSDESERFLGMKKQKFTKQIEIAGEEINIELP